MTPSPRHSGRSAPPGAPAPGTGALPSTLHDARDAAGPAPGAGAAAPARAQYGAEVVASVAYVQGRGGVAVPLDALREHADVPDGLLWVGLKEPHPEVLAQVGGQLGLEPQVLEEMQAPHRRPKILDFGPVVLVVAITIEVANERPALGETQLLIGRGFLVTVRRGATASHQALRARLESLPRQLARGSDFVASEVLDLLVDRYVAAAKQFEDSVEGFEQKLVLRGFKDAEIRKLYRLRRDLLRAYTVVAPLAEICRRLSRVEMEPIDPAARPYFGEVADRVLRVDELLNSLREALAFAFEAGLMIGQAQQTETTRKLAAWAAILAVPTAIAGIYGMNFRFMPELEWAWGYPAVMGVMGTLCAALFWGFRKAGWL
ncbi:magnesium and cobalt transport protein CorA [Orrella sp. JC864]|uniref:magnesium and cobalt transport protein CorA n=1 Tax=Orrella sp. JC864 TaxID=3120298 RepID=UPI00300BE530